MSSSLSPSSDPLHPEHELPEPGPGQRWSTWFSVTPSQRGPLPHPPWVVTESGAWDTELGILKTGKEADVHLVERAVPGIRDRAVILAAKRYRGPETSDFHRSSQYREGRRVRRSRDVRAIARGSSYGRELQAGLWAFAEFEALSRLHGAGLPVPYPVQVDGTELLMEFIGDGLVAAPRLAQSRLHGERLREPYEQVAAIVRGFARAGFAHGDLSAYNLLVHEGRVVVIDLPQLVDVVGNPPGFDLLHRDCRNVVDWFARRGLDVDAEDLFAEAVGQVY